MEQITKIKSDFNLTAQDEEMLKSLSPKMENYAESCINHLHRELIETGDAFLTEKLKGPNVYEQHKRWFIGLFCGVYDNKYGKDLIKIGKAHCRMNISPHYITLSANIIRDYMMDAFLEIFENRDERVRYRKVFHKILSINIDMIISSYMEEEIHQYSAAYKVKNALIGFAESFTNGMKELRH